MQTSFIKHASLIALSAFACGLPATALAQAPDTDPLACAALYRHYTPTIVERVPEADNLLRYDYEMRAVAAEAIGKANGQSAPKSDAVPGQSEFQDWKSIYECDQRLGFTPITSSQAKAEPDNLMCGVSLIMGIVGLGTPEPGSPAEEQYKYTEQTLFSVFAPLSKAGVSEPAQEAVLGAVMQKFVERHGDTNPVNPHNILTGDRALYHFGRKCFDTFPTREVPEEIFTWDRPNEQVCGAIETFMANAEANPYEPNLEPPDVLKADPYSALRCRRVGFNSTRFTCQVDRFFDPMTPDDPPSPSDLRKEMLSAHSDFGSCPVLQGWSAAEFGSDPGEYSPQKVGRRWTSPDGKRTLEWLATREYENTGRRKRKERVTSALAVEIQRD